MEPSSDAAPESDPASSKRARRSHFPPGMMEEEG